MINVMYHYVRPRSDNYPNLKYLDLDIFKRQLDFFKKEYGFLTKSEYKNAIKNGHNPKGVVLTFDDGFKDHANYVLPELVKRGLWGLFYVPTGVYNSKRMLGVHRIHYLIGKYGAKVILEELYNKIDENMLDHSLINQFDSEIYTGKDYIASERRLKRMLNYYISYKYRDGILDSLMEKFFNEDVLFRDFYLSKDDIKKLVLNGNVIGSHTVTHRVLSRLSYQEQYKEIKTSFDFIDSIVIQDYKSFCYPYGYRSSYNADTLEVLDCLRVDDACSFDNKIQHGIPEKYELSRIDCNQFLEVKA